MKVNEVMNKVMAVDSDINLKQAAKILSDKNIGSIVVLKKDKILGIITEKDIINNISNLGKKISNIMTKQVITIDHNDSLDNAALIMASHKIKRLPVVDKEKLVGIITATDIIANSDILNEDFFFD